MININYDIKKIAQAILYTGIGIGMMASLGCHKLPEAYSLKKEEPSMFYNDSDILKSSIRLTGILDISANSFHHTAYMCKKISEYSDNPLTNKECFSYNSTDEEIPESVSKIQEDKQPELERICQIIEDMNLNEDNKMNQEDIKAIIDQYQGADTIFSLIKSSQEERINLEDGRTETTNSITVYYDIGKNGRLDLILQSNKEIRLLPQLDNGYYYKPTEEEQKKYESILRSIQSTGQKSFRSVI